MGTHLNPAPLLRLLQCSVTWDKGPCYAVGSPLEIDMDLYGIGTAINGALRIYFHTARHTGRTRAMLNSVKDGDRIIFSNSIEAKRVQRMLKERGLEVTCMTLSPFDLQSVYAHKPQGRTIFDHTWVELFYEHAINNAQKLLDQMETQLSTVPEPRPMTKYREWVEDVWGQI